MDPSIPPALVHTAVCPGKTLWRLGTCERHGHEVPMLDVGVESRFSRSIGFSVLGKVLLPSDGVAGIPVLKLLRPPPPCSGTVPYCH